MSDLNQIWGQVIEELPSGKFEFAFRSSDTKNFDVYYEWYKTPTIQDTNCNLYVKLMLHKANNLFLNLTILEMGSKGGSVAHTCTSLGRGLYMCDGGMKKRMCNADEATKLVKFLVLRKMLNKRTTHL